METVAIPITVLISLITFFVTVGGVWFVAQKRLRDLELRASNQDKKHEQLISEIGGVKVDINGIKVEIAKLQGSVTSLNEKFDLFIQGRLGPAITPSP